MNNKEIIKKAHEYVVRNKINKNTYQVEKAFVDGVKMALRQVKLLNLQNGSVPKGTVCDTCDFESNGIGWFKCEKCGYSYAR